MIHIKWIIILALINDVVQMMRTEKFDETVKPRLLRWLNFLLAQLAVLNFDTARLQFPKLIAQTQGGFEQGKIGGLIISLVHLMYGLTQYF